MRRVLLSTDFSENADHAIEYALKLFDDEALEYCLCNSYKLSQNIPEMLISLEDILREQSTIGLTRALMKIKQNYRKLNIESISVHGDAPFAIRKIADERKMDLVVLGSRGRSVNGTFYGSTTTHLARKMTQPLLIVPGKQPLKSPEKIVLATDLVQIKDLNVLDSMLLIARKHGVEIVIVNIAGRDKQEQAMQAMERLDFNNHFEGIRSRFEVVESHDVVTGINNFTVEQGDLLVLAPKRYPYFRNMFHPRSATKGVVGQSEIPVMVI